MDDSGEINRKMKLLLKRVERRDTYGTLLLAGQVRAKAAAIDDPGE